MINLIVDFSANIYLGKKQDAVNRFAENSASEKDVKDILDAAKIKSKKELDNLFVNIASLRQSVNKKYSFMENKQKAVNIFNEAVVTLVKNGKIKSIVLVDVDCLASFMAAFGLCYWAYDECVINTGNSNNCAIALTACLSFVFISADQCFGIIGL